MRDEPGADVVEEQGLEAGAAISAVNWAEVLTKTAEVGEDPEVLVEQLQHDGLLGDALHIVSLDATDGPEIARLG